MATRFIESFGATAGDAATYLTTLKGDSAGVTPIVYDSVDGFLKFYDRLNSQVVKLVPTATPPVDAPATSLTITAALHGGKDIAMNEAAGTAFTLPLATGSGRKFRFYVTVASNANTIVCAGSDKLAGAVVVNDAGASSAVQAYVFRATVASHTTISPTTAGGGGAIGDWIEVADILSGVWIVSGVFQTSTDPVTPFS